MNFGGWLSIRYAQHRFLPMAHVHLVPNDDLMPHELSDQCWCEPVEVDDEGAMTERVFSHNAMDGREAFELQARLPS